MYCLKEVCVYSNTVSEVYTCIYMSQENSGKNEYSLSFSCFCHIFISVHYRIQESKIVITLPHLRKCTMLTYAYALNAVFSTPCKSLLP